MNNTIAIKNNEDNGLYHNITFTEECHNYEILDDARRHHSQDVSGSYICDDFSHSNKNNWKGSNFYRIMDPAGTQIREGCVAGDDACGAYGQGYITSGTHPTLPNQRAKMTVSFKNGAVCPPSSYWREVEIEAIHCGSYYIYYLLDLPGCSYAYCSETKEMNTAYSIEESISNLNEAIQKNNASMYLLDRFLLQISSPQKISFQDCFYKTL